MEEAEYLVYTGNEFRVVGGRRRPDMVVKKRGGLYYTVLELKQSTDKATFASDKIIDYAHAYKIDGVKYLIGGNPVDIKNFLVATELSRKGRILAKEVPYPEIKMKEKAERYAERPWGEPYCECARSGDFVRSMWRTWKKNPDKPLMKGISIGILLSTRNDNPKDTNKIPRPKMFVNEYLATIHKPKWATRWIGLNE